MRCPPRALPCLLLLRRAEQPLLCGLLLAAVAGALWLGWSAKSAASADRSSAPAGVWAGKHHGSSMTVGAEGRAERPATTEARDQCRLAFRLAAPDGATIAAVECTYKRFSRAERVGDADVTEVDPAADRRRWMWVAVAWLLALLACVLLSEHEQ